MTSRWQGGRTELAEAINLRDLLNGGDITFSVKDDINANGGDYEAPEDTFDPESLIQSANFDALHIEDDHDTDTPFDALKAKMIDLTSNGSVKKRILREGIGEVVSQHALVRINYEGFFEFNEVPFDSSTLRGEAFEFVLGCSGVVVGFDVAVASMRNKEKAEFILQPAVAFGKIGCPPRIPPNAEVLFRIEVVRWSQGAEASIAASSMNKEGEREWEPSKKAVEDLLRAGIALYKEKRFRESKLRLERAKNILGKCHLKSDEEEAEFKKYMFKVSLNLAIALNELQGHASFAPSAIIHLKDADSIQPGNHKVHCNWGKALMTLGDYDRAKDHLLRAKRLKNDDITVHECLKKLEMKMNKDKEVERSTWKRVFNPTSESSDNKHKEMSPQARKIVESLQEFKSSADRDLMILPAGFTPMEKEIIRSAAEDLNLNFDVRGTSISISK